MDNLTNTSLNGVTFYYAGSSLVAVEADGQRYTNKYGNTVFEDAVRSVCIDHEINDIPASH